MIRIPCVSAAVLALAAAACGPGRPAPVPEQWVVLREDAGQRVSLNVLSIRTEPPDIRTASIATAYTSVQETDSVRFDHEEISVQFHCRRGAMRTEGGARFLGDEIALAWMAGPPPIYPDGRDGREWDNVPPGTYLDDAMKLVCRSEP
ncbi:MAG TPA: surface-adhesin E family protein [Longimicrobium sp.]|nr:surface-adhesin E family protein [Longimicrobium sp.]